jgi:hypothetical protein
MRLKPLRIVGLRSPTGSSSCLGQIKILFLRNLLPRDVVFHVTKAIVMKYHVTKNSLVSATGRVGTLSCHCIIVLFKTHHFIQFFFHLSALNLKMKTLEALFQSTQLDVVVPTSSLRFPSPDDGDSWISSLNDSTVERDKAFFGIYTIFIFKTEA